MRPLSVWRRLISRSHTRATALPNVCHSCFCELTWSVRPAPLTALSFCFRSLWLLKFAALNRFGNLCSSSGVGITSKVSASPRMYALARIALVFASCIDFSFSTSRCSLANTAYVFEMISSMLRDSGIVPTVRSAANSTSRCINLSSHKICADSSSSRLVVKRYLMA